MSWLTLTEGMLIGLLLFSGFFSLLLYYKNIDKEINITFFFFAVFLGSYLVHGTLSYFSESPADFIRNNRIADTLLVLSGLAFIHFVSKLTKQNNRILKTAMLAPIFVFGFVNLLAPYGINYTSEGEIIKVQNIFNETLSFYTGTVSDWNIFVGVYLIFLLVYILLSIKKQYNEGYKASALLLLFSLCLGIIGQIFEVASFYFNMNSITPLDDIGFFAFTLIIGQRNFVNVIKFSQIREELIKSEENFKLLAENSQDLICKHDLEGRIIYASPASLKLIGYSPEEIYDTVPVNLFHPDDLEMIRDIYVKLLSGQNNLVVTYRMQKKSGEYIWVESSCAVITNEGTGNPSGIITSTRDIADRKKAEEAIIESEAKYRNLFETMPNGFYRSTPAGRFVDVNPAFVRMLGYDSKEELLKVYIPETLYVKTEERDEILFRNPEFVQQTDIYRLRKKDGSIIWVEDNARYIQNENGEVIFHEGICLDITERILASHALTEKENRLRLIIDSAPFGAYVWELRSNGEFMLITANKSADRIMGTDHKPMIGKPMFTLFPEMKYSELPQIFKRILSTGENYDSDETLLSGNGIFEVHAFKLNKNQTAIFFRDVTEKRKAENALERSLENFKEVFEISPFPIIIIDPESGNVIEVNSKYSEMIGVPREELLGKNPSDFVGKKINDKIREEFFKRGRIDNFEVKLKTRDGREVYHIINSIMIEFNRKPATLTVIHDITDIRETQRELEYTYQYVQHIMDSISTAIISIDTEFVVTHFNKAAKDFIGDEAAGYSDLFELFPKLRFVEEELYQSLRTQEVAASTKTLVDPDGLTKYFSVSVYPLKNVLRPGYAIMVEDISERKKMDEILIESEKMISIAGLAAGMAHEINNPLGTIVQGCQNIIRRTTSGLPRNESAASELGLKIEVIEDYFKKRQIFEIIESMNKAAGKASEIIKNMLQFSRKSESKKVNYHIKKLIDQVIELAYNDYDLKKKYDLRNIKIETEIEEDLPELRITVTEIEQVLFNLIRNAAQAIRETDGRTEPLIRIRAFRVKDNIKIEVEDNGPGIPEHIRSRIFEPFFTTKEIGEGTGLGLSVSYMIITKNHKGKLNFETALDKGTKFNIFLPIEN